MTPLFSVTLEHGYFPAGSVQPFEVVPLADTARLMARYQLRLQCQQGVFCLLAGRADASFVHYLGQQARQGELNFWLCCAPALFVAITQLPGDWLGTLRLATQPGSLQLTPVAGERLPGRSDAVALLSLNLEHLLAVGPAPSYQARFEARSLGWDYYLVNRSEVLLQAPAVVGGDGQCFDGPNAVRLPSGEQALHFSSGTRRFAVQQVPTETFDLVDRISPGHGQAEVEHCYLKGLPTPGQQQLCAGTQLERCAMHVYL